MIITAKFNGRCAKCGTATRQGEPIEYENKQAFHVGCVPAAQNELSDSDQLALADQLHYTRVPRFDLWKLPFPITHRSGGDDRQTRERKSILELPEEDD